MTLTRSLWEASKAYAILLAEHPSMHSPSFRPLLALGTASMVAACGGRGGDTPASPVTVTSILVTPPAASIAQGTTVQLTATPRDVRGNALSGRAIVWSSSNVGIATVTLTGLVAGLSAGGPIAVTATSEGKTGAAQVTVTAPPVASVTVSPATASVTVGGMTQLVATLRDAGNNVLAGRSIVWSTSSAAIATVSAAGLVSGVAAGGPVAVRATSEGISGAAQITVTAPVTGGPYVSPRSYQTAVLDGYVVADPTRMRTLAIRIRRPVGAPPPLPLVIFSPGGGANPQGHMTHEEWGTRLASAGYAVIHMAHPAGEPSAHCAPLRIPAVECDSVSIASGATLGPIWYQRPRDATAVINDLSAIEAATGARFDFSRIAIAGHSGGAHTVMSTSGTAVDWSASVKRVIYREPRIRAFLANSPQGIGIFGMSPASWDSISPPVMVTTGRADSGGATDDPTLRLHPFQHMPAPDKYQLYVDSPDAVHNVFGLNAATGAGDRPLTKLEEYVFASGLAFLDAYVRELPPARAWLRSREIEGWSAGVAKISWK